MMAFRSIYSITLVIVPDREFTFTFLYKKSASSIHHMNPFAHVVLVKGAHHRVFQVKAEHPEFHLQIKK